MKEMRGWIDRFRRNRTRALPPRVPDGVRIYAIGDIHGCVDLLDGLHEKILDDAEANARADQVIVYLGDYIDRGPQSSEVIERLLTRPLPGFRSIYLQGNHEAMMRDFLIGRSGGQRWIDLGGRSTLASYMVPVPASFYDAADVEKLRTGLAERVPVAHRTFLEQLDLYHIAEDYIFVHAGIRPNAPLAKQTATDMLWIREPFLGHRKFHEKFVVHGHSAAGQPEILANRICIDTGAYATGVLSCVVLEGTERRMLAARRGTTNDA